MMPLEQRSSIGGPNANHDAPTCRPTACACWRKYKWVALCSFFFELFVLKVHRSLIGKLPAIFINVNSSAAVMSKPGNKKKRRCSCDPKRTSQSEHKCDNFFFLLTEACVTVTQSLHTSLQVDQCNILFICLLSAVESHVHTLHMTFCLFCCLCTCSTLSDH